jgi:hypothetical protein
MKRRTLFAVLAAVAVALASFTLLSSHASPASASPQSSTSRTFYVTLYGWPDNSPPGADIAYPKNGGYPTLHNSAGGAGTYSNPITYATDKSELAIGTKVYYPYLKKYFIMEDDCVECDEDWTGQGPDGGPGFYHIDLWIGGENGDPNAVINCEDALTQQGDVELDPPSTEPVDTTPLFDSSSNTCYDPSSFTG